MEKITEGAGLGWGEDQLNIEIGVQRRSMGWSTNLEVVSLSVVF